MSNEELATQIQSGRQDLMLPLWEQNQSAIVKHAYRVMVALGASAGLEVEDLVQSAYFALVAAVEAYKPGEWKFTTYLRKHLQTAFAEATGYRTEKGRRDPIRHAISLETPLGDDQYSGTLGDLVPDPKAEAICGAVEDQIYIDQLKAAFVQLLPELPEDQRITIQRRYWDGCTYDEVGDELGTGSASARTAEQKAIRYFRRPAVASKLRPFYEFDYLSGTGLGAFRSSGSSIQERYLMWQERTAVNQ